MAPAFPRFSLLIPGFLSRKGLPGVALAFLTAISSGCVSTENFRKHLAYEPEHLPAPVAARVSLDVAHALTPDAEANWRAWGNGPVSAKPIRRILESRPPGQRNRRTLRLRQPGICSRRSSNLSDYQIMATFSRQGAEAQRQGLLALGPAVLGRYCSYTFSGIVLIN